ncbi:DUF1801 domain-containing protein [Leptospira wolffii]|uniref:DUF1801 domain-containing protein n=1 Tax=Leptospira wolffii TaxID=409998 RepID=A0ABV5BP54_9LEPT|nr:DUF1801 domain-containing protein [Leptospira wolffii]TGL47342.1 DUF1801 domain-containing protein [Leptospira wolffii]
MKDKKFVKFQNQDIAEIFADYPAELRERLLYLRGLIFQVASETEGVGRIEEVIKWGQPSYITPESKSGSTIRIDKNKAEENGFAIFFHCQTNLISSFRKKFRQEFRFEGDRSILFTTKTEIPEKALKECIADALTYHFRKKQSASQKSSR